MGPNGKSVGGMSSNCDKSAPVQWGRGGQKLHSWATSELEDSWVQTPGPSCFRHNCGNMRFQGFLHWAGTKQVLRCSSCLRPFPFWARACHSTCSWLLQSSQHPAPHLSPALSAWTPLTAPTNQQEATLSWDPGAAPGSSLAPTPRTRLREPPLLAWKGCFLSPLPPTSRAGK